MKARPSASPAVRTFRTDDLSAVQALIDDTIDVCYTGVYPPAAVAYFKKYHSADKIRQDAVLGYFVVAEYGGRTVGCGVLLGTTIKRVFVSPAYQHRGIGRSIITCLEGRALSDGVVRVDLDASLPSWQWYRWLGYSGRRMARIRVGTGQYLDYYPMTKALT